MIPDHALQLEDGSWLTVETADNEERMIALFIPRQWDALEVAEKAIANANMRLRPGRPIVAGVYKDALVLAIRVRASQLDQRALDEAVSELQRFKMSCL